MFSKRLTRNGGGARQQLSRDSSGNHGGGVFVGTRRLVAGFWKTGGQRQANSRTRWVSRVVRQMNGGTERGDCPRAQRARGWVVKCWGA